MTIIEVKYLKCYFAFCHIAISLIILFIILVIILYKPSHNFQSRLDMVQKKAFFVSVSNYSEVIMHVRR